MKSPNATPPLSGISDLSDLSDLSSPRQIARCYVRVSEVGGRDTQTEANPHQEFLSPGIQLDSAADWAARNGYSFDRENSLRHQDLGHSGFKKHWQQRPGIMAHLAAAQRGAFDKLIVYKLSRLARRTEDALQMIREFERAGVGIYAIKEAIDTSTAAGRMVQTIMLAVAEMQSEDIRDWSSATVSRRAAAGKIQGAPPIWIRRDIDTGLLELNEAAAAPVLRLIELREEMLGYTRIARRMNAEGFRTEDGTFWTALAVARYFTPRFIDRFGGCHRIRMADGKVHINWSAYPPLIDRDRLDNLKRLRRMTGVGNSHHQGPGQGHQSHPQRRRRGAAIDTPYLIASRIYCAICGGRLYTSGTSVGAGEGARKSRVYRCVKGIENMESHASGKSISVSAPMIEQAVLAAIQYVFRLRGPDAGGADPGTGTSTSTSAAPRKSLPKPRPGTQKSPIGTQDDTVESLTEALSEIVVLRATRRMTSDAYDKAQEKLLERLAVVEAREQAADEPQVMESALAAAAEGRWRLVVLSLVKRVMFPVDAPEAEERTGRGRGARRRAVLVEFKTPTPIGSAVIAPLYQNNWHGVRNLYTPDGTLVYSSKPIEPIEPIEMGEPGKLGKMAQSGKRGKTVGE